MTFGVSDKTRALLDLFLEAEKGTVFTYADIDEKTGLSIEAKDRGRIYTVRRILERDHNRSIDNVRGEGYKVLQAREHVRSMAVRKGKASRQIELARKTGNATEVAELTSAEVAQWADAQTHLSRIGQVLLLHESRLTTLERRLDDLAPALEPAIEGQCDEE